MVHARTASGRAGTRQSTGVPTDGGPLSDTSPDETAAAAGSHQEMQRQPATVLFVGKRATARQLRATLTDCDTAPPALHEPVSDRRIELGQRICLIVVTSQRAALQLVKTEPPRVVMVEVDNRPQSRIRFCRMLRSRVPAMAILAVGDKQSDNSFTFDDFLPLPLTEDQITSAVYRVRDRYSCHLVECGPFRLNLATRTVHTPNGPRHMTPKLCALLELLMLRHDEVVSRSDIMKSIWETSYLEDTRTLDVHVRWLREYIEPDPSLPVYLLTERGAGYTFQLR